MSRPALVLGAACTTIAAVATPPGGRGGCDRHQKPFAVPAESVFATVKTIALPSVWIQPKLGEAARLRGVGTIGSLVEQELRGAGFGVVAPGITDSLWRVVVDSVGGVFDTRTGERDSAKMAAARAIFFSRLKQGYNADALLHIAVRIVSADFEKWTATWDGTHQTFENFGHRFKSALLHGQYKGRTRALSLFAGLENTNGQLLYDGRGGLQVYVMPKDGKFIDVPDSVFFADTARNATAVHLAVCQLVTRGGG